MKPFRTQIELPPSSKKWTREFCSPRTSTPTCQMSCPCSQWDHQTEWPIGSVAICARTMANIFDGVATAPGGSGTQGGGGQAPRAAGTGRRRDRQGGGTGRAAGQAPGPAWERAPRAAADLALRAAGDNTKRQPLGELISADLELAGLKGQSVYLSWSIFQKGTARVTCLGNGSCYFVAYRLVATTNDDTGTLEMWIPLPQQPGSVFHSLDLDNWRCQPRQYEQRAVQLIICVRGELPI